ncbi:MAG: ferritin-like domain-containing protein [Candidatus Heimdallarchaeota archaeon]|nr:ferritin-like domain-containing protein [Candidatus Heimdallarchaeota archaeon]
MRIDNKLESIRIKNGDLQMNKDERVNFYKKQIELEKKIVEAAEAAVVDMKNITVRELILGIAKDSTKHASLLDALIALNIGTTPLLREEITDQLKFNLEEHIRLEEQAIDSYKDIWEQLEDEREKAVIKAILNDEIRHHALLKRIHRMIVEKETLTEQDVWDWTWKDSISHGSPGG